MQNAGRSRHFELQKSGKQTGAQAPTMAEYAAASINSSSWAVSLISTQIIQPSP
jgi:hypothetical protein